VNNRVYKFRAWDIGLKEMVTDFLLSCDGVPMVETNGGNLSFNGIILQYTGLLDKNGKEIYEADVVKKHFMKRDRTIGFDVYTVTWDNKYASFFLGSGYHKDWIDEGENEVIGNIYENPELLKEEK
jgi:hypothetical protein